MPGSRLSLPAGPPKHKCHRHKFRKQAVKLAAAAAAVLGGPGSLSAAPGFSSAAPGSLSAAGLAGSSEPAAAASLLGGNSVRNCVEFCDLG